MWQVLIEMEEREAETGKETVATSIEIITTIRIDAEAEAEAERGKEARSVTMTMTMTGTETETMVVNVEAGTVTERLLKSVRVLVSHLFYRLTSTTVSLQWRLFSFIV